MHLQVGLPLASPKTRRASAVSPELPVGSQYEPVEKCRNERVLEGDAGERDRADESRLDKN